MSTAVRTRAAVRPAPPPTSSTRTRPRSPLVYAEISGPVLRRRSSGATPTGSSTSASASSCWSASGAGLALTGLRPIVHTFGSFLVERAFEQVKLDFGHQDVGGVLVGVGGSFDIASGGRTHQSPGRRRAARHPARLHHPRARAPPPRSTRPCARPWPATGSALRPGRRADQRASVPAPPGRFHVVRRGAGATVIALGPVLDAVLAATADRDVTVLYASTVRPFDGRRPPGGARARPTSCSWSPGWPAPRPTWSPTRCATCRTGCSRSASAASSCATTARRPSTSPRTASTPPGSGPRSTGSVGGGLSRCPVSSTASPDELACGRAVDCTVGGRAGVAQ